MIEIGNGGGLSSAAAAPGGTMHPWAVGPAMAGAGWTMGSSGTVENGGLCLTAQAGVELTACSAGKAAAQQFTLEKNGNLHLTAHKDSCLALQARLASRL